MLIFINIQNNLFHIFTNVQNRTSNKNVAKSNVLRSK